MYRFLILVCAIVCFSSCKKQEGNINGTLRDAAENTWVYLEKIDLNGTIKVDSCLINKQQFWLTHNEDSINFYRISLSANNYALIVLEKNDTLQFSANANSLVNYKASGSDEIDANNKLMTLIQSLNSKTDSLRKVYQNSIGTDQEKSVLQNLRSDYDKITDNYKTEIENFIDQHQGFFVTLIACQQLGEISENLDYYKSVYNHLEQSFPSNKWVNNLKQKVQKVERTAIGAIAPNFIVNDTQGQAFSLTSLRGSIVLIDFWASWCAPCRRENPLLLELYKEFHPKGLQMVGISLDDTSKTASAKKDWLMAISKDQLVWKQLSELQGFDSQVCQDYGIESIPSTFIIDQKGVIIAHNLRGTELRNKLLEIFD